MKRGGTAGVLIACALVVVAATAHAGEPTLAPGVHARAVAVAGVERSWTVVVPPTVHPPSPLLVVLHGVGGRGGDMRTVGFEALAAAAGVVVAYPDGFASAWNDGRPGADPVDPGHLSPDDVAFLRELVERTDDEVSVNRRRVGFVGYSNGAMMASRVACAPGMRVAALALVGGTAGEGFEEGCDPARPVPVVAVASRDDPIVPYGGGEVQSWRGLRRGRVVSSDAFSAFWFGANRCGVIDTTNLATAGLPVEETVGSGCAWLASVVRYRLDGAGHQWYRGPGFDTTAAVWDFVAPRLLRPAIRPFPPQPLPPPLPPLP